jgi:hypothetical protein
MQPIAQRNIYTTEITEMCVKKKIAETGDTVSYTG